MPSAHASHVEADVGGAQHLSADPDAKNIKSHDLAGNRGEPQTEGDTISADPSQAAYEQLQHRAYPADSLPASVTIAAQLGYQTYGENKQYTGASNTNNPFKWDLIGPTHATQPGILSFSGAQYHMAGRVTAEQISPTCTSSRCRLWVAEAGGGIWRTDNPLSPDPYWVFVSQSFATNAIGTIDRDPNDPTGNTLYAGTGEENASGDSEAGVGIYKTTNGGDTWTFVPRSQMVDTR